MPIVDVRLTAGRSRKLRDTLAERLSQVVMDTLKAEPASVRVILHEVPAEDWFVGGRPLRRPKAGPRKRRG